MASGRVAQLPKFAVVDVMIELNGRECLHSDRWDVKDAFWKSVLNRLNELYPENVSDVRTVNHVKRTWSALRQRVLQRSDNGEHSLVSSSDRRVLYLLGIVDNYDDVSNYGAGSPMSESVGTTSPIPTSTISQFAASIDPQQLLSLSFSSPDASALNKNLEPLLDAMIICGGRVALTKRRATQDGKNEYKAFWDRVHMMLQFNSKFSGRSVLSYQRAWHNARTLFAKRVQNGDRDNSLLERKALYLMRVLSMQKAQLEIDNGIVCDTSNSSRDSESMENNHDNAKVCTVLKTEPLTLELLNSLTRGVMEPMQQENENYAESASMSPPPVLRSPRVNSELEHKLILCKIEREKAQTELLKAQQRLVEAQLRNLDKTGVDLNLLDF
ncbi:hypothetical protein M3Y94_00584400 [Aphelenchoides besseyi]|nr:hypothetical protein M3Y94_00584400 [Aphelenchoides besseyi]KAI6222064.1 hypothetical protein M3Y95_00944900 [Aphelenchoides besseyi]